MPASSTPRKATSVWLVPLASLLREYTGGWRAVFVIAAIMNLTVAALALFALKPLRRRALSRK